MIRTSVLEEPGLSQEVLDRIAIAPIPDRV